MRAIQRQPVTADPVSRLSPRLAQILARMLEAKLAAARGSQRRRMTVSSDDLSPGRPHEDRRHAR